MSETPRLIDAKDAAARLKVSTATLYAYVSRGLIRAYPHPGDPRARLYSSVDIAAHVARKALSGSPRRAAAGALDWGLPTLATEISEIARGQLRYRGRDALALAETATFEDVAALLVGEDTLSSVPFDAGDVPGWMHTSKVMAQAEGLARPLALLPLLLPGETPGLSSARLRRRGGVLVRALALSLVPDLRSDASFDDALASAFGAPTARDAIRRALVLLADHEMNASTFTVRVIASTGATLTAVLLGGLGALSGPRHGGMLARVRALMNERDAGGDPEDIVRARLGRGEAIPGFGHRLYPDGDPRARSLLATLPMDRDKEILAAVDGQTGHAPSIDFALVALERAHGLPEGAALALFAIARSVGWIAHAIEQNETGHLIRPRARFVADDPA